MIYKRMRAKIGNVKLWIKLNRHKERMRTLWDRFRVKINGHIRYYGVSYNSRSVGRFIFKAIGTFFKWINRRSGRRSMRWENFLKFINQYPLPKNKVYHSLQNNSL